MWWLHGRVFSTLKSSANGGNSTRDTKETQSTLNIGVMSKFSTQHF